MDIRNSYSIFEQSKLFQEVLEDSDIVTKEMYSWEDKGNIFLTLRPELTASVVRAFNQHNLKTSPDTKILLYRILFRKIR